MIFRGRGRRAAITAGACLAVLTAACATPLASLAAPPSPEDATLAEAASPEADAVTQIVTAAHLGTGAGVGASPALSSWPPA